MRKLAPILLLAMPLTALAAILLAQSVNLYVPIWTGNRYIWAVLGKTLAVTGGVLDVVPPAQKTRVYGVKLSWDAIAGGYPLPAGASAVAVYVNGVRYVPQDDYTIVAGVVIPGSGGNWAPPADAVVLADYDSP